MVLELVSRVQGLVGSLEFRAWLVLGFRFRGLGCGVWGVGCGIFGFGVEPVAAETWSLRC